MLEILSRLSRKLASETSVESKMALLDALPQVQNYKKPLKGSLERRLAYKQLIAIGQEKLLELPQPELEKLLQVDSFYRELGGIVGYHTKILELLNRSPKPLEMVHYHSPFFIDISQNAEEAVSWGLEAMPEMAEMYPLGGAADRLHLVDEASGMELPAAKLPFAGRTLLEGLLRDLAAREALYYQKFGKKLVTPIAMMTSQEKNNHFHVQEICEQNRWFGRPKEMFRFFIQPLVPTVNERGEWCTDGTKPLLKPGGHGALWKLARDEGVFDWLQSLGCKKVLVRQINNPIAGLDDGLLAFTGIGWKKNMVFGFASCPRLLQAAEGVNVLIERKRTDGSEVVLTNVEYCDFEKFGIEDKPLKEGEPYSRFSSNTNILFADLESISKAIDACPFPGLLVNLKKGVGRLESTMQNIADVFVEPKKPDESLEPSKTFVTYNRRHKTISTAKKAYHAGGSLQETPENCFYDLLTASRELLQQCGVVLPDPRSLQEYLKLGPEFVFLYHPSLGPLYSIISQKMRGGTIAAGSELIVETPHFQSTHLKLDGSLQVFGGNCLFENVTVQNKGVDWSSSSPFWKMDLRRFETTKIVVKGSGKLIVRNSMLSGDQCIVIEDGEERIIER